MSISYRYLLYKKSYNTSTEIKPTEKISFCTCYTFLRVPSSHFNPETYQPRPKLLMTKVTSTCFRIIKTKKTSTKPSWNGISEKLSNRSTPVNINTGGEIGNTVPARTWHSQKGWWGRVERRRRSCPLRSGDSFLRLFITEQRRNSNSDWAKCALHRGKMAGREAVGARRQYLAGSASTVTAPAFGPWPFASCLLVSSGTICIHSVSVTPTGTVSSLMVACKWMAICT